MKTFDVEVEEIVALFDGLCLGEDLSFEELCIELDFEGVLELKI